MNVRETLFACCLLTVALGREVTALGEDVRPLTFEQDIRPILREHCFDCHGAEKEKKGELDLRLVRFHLIGGESGPAIVAGDPKASLLIQRIESGEMPPGSGKVSAKDQKKLHDWIAAGATTKAAEPDSIPEGLGISEEDRQWWAFQPIVRPVIDPAAIPLRARRPIDALLTLRMPEGVSFSDDAPRSTLLKRLSFDLLGLPPTLAEIESFEQSETADAVERMGDRLLASPHYGERWARHWLDVVGYADSDGGAPADSPRPHAYRYRDYVIDSLNADKPFDRFIEEQLAGDELAGPIVGELSPRQIELLTATGFLRMAADGTGSGDDSPEARQQVVADTIKIVSTTLLGLTIACAQCHDHRYDPLLQRDYYSMRAILEPALDCQNWRTPPSRLVSLYTKEDRRKAAEIAEEARNVAEQRKQLEQSFIKEATQKELSRFPEPLQTRLRDAIGRSAEQRTPEDQQLLDQNPSVNITAGVLYQFNPSAAEELKKIDQRIGEIQSRRPVEEFVQSLVEPFGPAPPTHRFHRGDYRQPLETVEPAILTVLSATDSPARFDDLTEKFSTTRRRLAFARWLASADNPLTRRVLVNRFWMHHFGKGLVPTVADFGRLGTLPTQPELLDWLADEFLGNGWSFKALHREMIESTAYRQSSRRNATDPNFDPENKYLARRGLVRIDAETLRDRVLMSGGALDPAMHGPAIPLSVDDSGQVVIAPNDRRRAIYTTQRRSQPVALMQAFDAPVMQTNCESRTPSTVATQSLMLMNGGFVLDYAHRIADRAWQESVPSIPPHLSGGWDESISRPGTPIWQFGYGSVEPTSSLVTFRSLPHWTGSSWQGGESLPSPTTGWVSLHAHGGHPGANPQFAAIRRWTAPASGTVAIQGSLHHPSENGDGVRGRVVHHGRILMEWNVLHGQVATEVPTIQVNVGDTIDFVLDCREHETSDSFSWDTQVTLVRGDNRYTYPSADGFGGPVEPSSPLTPDVVARVWVDCYSRWPSPDELRAAARFLSDHLEELELDPSKLPSGRTPTRQALTHLAQVLLNSNEFLYVD